MPQINVPLIWMFPMSLRIKLVLTIISMDQIIGEILLACLLLLAYNSLKIKSWLKDYLQMSLLTLSKFKQIN